MGDNDSQATANVSDDVSGVAEERAEPDFDNLAGIVADGFIGAVGGLVGTAVLTGVLLVAAQFGAFELGSFATLAELTGADVLLPSNTAAVGYVLFLATGMVMWPLLFASIGSYLPGEKFAAKGVPFGVVLWTGFVLAFYEGFGGLTLAAYVVLTLVAHIAYGFTLGSVFDYFSNRPETLV